MESDAASHHKISVLLTYVERSKIPESVTTAQSM